MASAIGQYYWWYTLVTLSFARGLVRPFTCKSGQYFEPGTLTCETCPSNASLVPSADGFGCSCEEHSVPAGMARCRPCNATEVLSSDGMTCVPRKCQSSSGRTVCRKCSGDYITVTQNFDGSPLKEVLCVKCARGFKAENNRCVRCESCICAKNQVIVRGICVPKSYVVTRPKYEENSLHPVSLLDVVKHEYLCTQNDVRACRTLANDCVRNFYSADPAGPCRLWTQPNLTSPKGLPQLTMETKTAEGKPGEINLARGKGSLFVTAALHSADGSFKFLQDEGQKATLCRLPVQLTIGKDSSYDCTLHISAIRDYLNSTLSPFIHSEGGLIQVPVFPWKPNGYTAQRGPWPSSKFRRYFLVENSLSVVANITNTVYLRSTVLKLRVDRDHTSPGSLRVHLSMAAHYATKSHGTDMVTMSLRILHDMPSAGVVRGLEIWGGVLGSLLSLYAMVKWRGVVRRGGLYVAMVPLLAGSIADTLYFAALLSTLHALAAEAGTLGITLPLSRAEENIIRIFLYSAGALKVVKVAWFNFNQCRSDVFLLDWSEYNPPFRDTSMMDKLKHWRASTLAREWSAMQTKRRVCPGHTVALALLILQLLASWQATMPQSQGYRWVVATLAWWASYTTFLLARWISDKVLGSPTAILPKLCISVGLSLLVFEEENYAHYVHGRSDDSKDLRSMTGPLATCRVVCAPQLRTVYKQLSTSVQGLGEIETKQALLSRFLAAFFERALDGLSWVASERTVLERLLDVELSTREAGNTSTLLYDPDESAPSCFAVTWWGEEWSLSTLDAMLYGCVLISSDDPLLAALITLVVWQIMKIFRGWLGMRNITQKTDIELQWKGLI